MDQKKNEMALRTWVHDHDGCKETYLCIVQLEAVKHVCELWLLLEEQSQRHKRDHSSENYKHRVVTIIIKTSRTPSFRRKMHWVAIQPRASHFGNEQMCSPSEDQQLVAILSTLCDLQKSSPSFSVICQLPNFSKLWKASAQLDPARPRHSISQCDLSNFHCHGLGRNLPQRSQILPSPWGMSVNYKCTASQVVTEYSKYFPTSFRNRNLAK